MRIESLWMPQFLERGDRKMAGLKRSTLPVMRFGRTSTEPSVTISENGQLRMNKLAMDAIGKTKTSSRKGKDRSGAEITTKILHVYVDFNEEKRALTVASSAVAPKGWADEDLFVLAESKGGGGYISMAPVFRQVGYDFQKSGNQSVTPQLNAEKQLIRVTVPKGALEAKPKVERAKKVKAAASGATKGEPEDISLD